MTDVNGAPHAAEQRVRRFMAEYEAQWRIAAPAFAERKRADRADAFRQWQELMAQTTRTHFIDSSTVELGQSFGTPAEYGPEVERIIRTEAHGDIAYVLTQGTPPLDKFHEYTVRAQGHDWRIAAIAHHFGDPTQPFIDSATVAERMRPCAADAPLTEPPDEQARLDETRNFTDRDVVRDGETARARVSPIGTLVTGTGVLAVRDFGYENDGAHPLARTVTPGSYPVERVTAFGRNAAVRVRFTDRTPVSWHPASLTGGGHVFGVDTASMCLVDYVAYSAMTRRAKEAEYNRLTGTPRPAAIEIPLGLDVGIACDTGYGDGSYPAYWGADVDGGIAQLVVDFMVLVDRDDDGALRHM